MHEGNPTSVPPGEQGERTPEGRTPASPPDGDFELAKPAVAAPPARNADADTAVAGPVPTGAGPVTGRPKPLHDPDPCSTPPYGGPGPWAPAPPVQHPAAPAAGTAVPTSAAPVAPGMPSGPVVSPQVPLQAAPAGAEPLASTGPAPEAGSPAQAAPEAGPWQRYDPWAAAAAGQAPPAHGPLQQTGAKVLTARQRRRRALRITVLWTLLVAVVSSGMGGLAGAWVERERETRTEPPRPGAMPAPDSVAAIAARALPGVVTLHVHGADESGTGTGFVLDDRGHVLTNNHVVRPAASGGDISVTLSTGETAKAKIVGRDSGYDLAVVQITRVHGLTPLPLGNSDDVRVGDPVVAIGAPFGLAGTVTSGIISAKERPITAGGDDGDGSDVSYVDALQTDAPINPGNSGGPLLDSRARVIGINSVIRSADGGTDSDGGQAGSIGLGFAIPVNQARRVADELIDKGHATHPVIGVNLDMGYTGDGARVDDKARGGGPAVVRGGPGDRAGLQPGDVITEVDGQRVHSGEELIIKVRAHRPGDRLRLTVEHGGEREVSVVLGEQN
ncbi:S1C family serine protease [Streptomyces bungoensis]|uniref:S1C family serine protease n=1 Tax=Streptomyces bungoensis TaxID=285568 RepID=UPI000AC52AC4|nr:trypsin-like peptidase domain-containing protein [Streptomyces bungoensis]